jgi:hypothetical protein
VPLEEDVALGACIEAAGKDVSVSRLLGTLLRERMVQQDAYERAMKRTLGRKPFLNTDGKYLSREEVHDPERLLR